MRKYGTWIALGLFVLQASLLILLDLFFVININYDWHRVVVAFMFLLCAGTAFYYGYLCGWKLKKSIIITALSLLACPGISIVLEMYLLYNVGAIERPITFAIVMPQAICYALVYFILQMLKIKDPSVLRKVIAGVLCGVFILAQCVMPIGDYLRFTFKVPTMTGFSKYTEKEYQKVNGADIYVATDGDDMTGNGTFEYPFATIERAQMEVRLMPKNNTKGIVVAIKAGEYRTNLEFTEEDSGTVDCPITYCAYGDGEVVINGGKTLRPQDFTAIADGEMKNRLKKDARDKVLQLNLVSLGISEAQYGKIYPLGDYNTASKYDEYREYEEYGAMPMYSELFFNDRRMNLARYPDSGYIKTGKVVQQGKGLESDGSKTADPDYWEKVTNPPGDTYKLSNDLAKRIATWKTFDDVWMYGFFKYTWADASTPIGNFDAKNKTLTTKFVSRYGAIEGAPYYFFNVFEELDAPGEWYLDRKTGILYMYPSGDMENATIDLTLSQKPVVSVKASNITFKKLTIKGTRENGMEFEGDNNRVLNCLIKNVGGDALLMNGYHNEARENEITRTGKGGITLDGGDVEHLTPSESIADNNLIHDWAEINIVYHPAVTLSGVGNICSHNEMYNSAHEAVTYSGNNHIIEYNNIHDVCLLSDDAGAIYSGRRWDWYGTVIRYNAVYDLGSGEHHPCGIYMDDALAGQTIYGNILVNVPDVGIELGGGRDLIVKNNIIINTNSIPVSYDDRAREGALNEGWFSHSSKADGDLWINLEKSPWKTSAEWKEQYGKYYDHYSSDFSDTESLDFAPNPSYSEVTGNIVINIYGDFVRSIGRIAKDVYKFSKVENNYVYGWTKASKIFVDYKNGDYRLREDSITKKDLPDFEPIPIAKIGRY